MTTAERLATIETMLAEVHSSVVGNGARNSSLRERVAGLEEWRHGQDGVRQRSVRAASNAILTAAVAIVVSALHLTTGGHA